MGGSTLQEITNVIGFYANVAFMVCCLPEAVQCLRLGKTDMPITVAYNVTIACVLYFIYAVTKYTQDYLTWGSSLIEVPCYCVIIWYHYFPRKT